MNKYAAGGNALVGQQVKAIKDRRGRVGFYTQAGLLDALRDEGFPFSRQGFAPILRMIEAEGDLVRLSNGMHGVCIFPIETFSIVRHYLRNRRDAGHGFGKRHDVDAYREIARTVRGWRK